MPAKIDRREFLTAGGAMSALISVPGRPLLGSSIRVRVAKLRTEYIDRPLGLETPNPRLSWQLESDARNVRQNAYRVLVASSEEALRAGHCDLWDSGKVNSRRSFGIPYQGRELASRQRCWWSVQVWDEHGEASPPSAPSWWEMGLLDPQDWTAQWLAVENAVDRADREEGLHWIWGTRTQDKTTRQFRFKFQLPAASQSSDFFAITNDIVLFTQIGRVWLDGERIAGRGAWSDNIDEVGIKESDTVLREFKSLRAGEHLIAVEVHTADLNVTTPLRVTPMTKSNLVHGLAVFMRFNLENGETLRIGSRTNWKTRLAQADEWYQPGYDDTTWELAQTMPIGHQPWPAQPAMHLRRTFALNQPVRTARLYATALGAYEARLNGSRVGNALLTPEISQYAKRVLYQVYDVTELLLPGTNVLGLTVGDGWYASFDDRYAWGLPPRRVLAQLEIIFGDGSRRIFATDPEWRIAESAILESQMQSGELYDARREQPGWDTLSFDASQWHKARMAEAPPGRLVAQVSPPIRVTETLKPKTITQPTPGVYVFEFGQNFAGWCRIKVKGDRGTRIELQSAEWLAASGEVQQTYSDSGVRKQDVFILKGEAAGEIFEPHFTYRGIRYVQVKGLSAAPTLDELEGVVLHTDLKMTGRLRTASPLIEQIWRNHVWTRRSTFVAVPTDATRREQRPYTGCTALCWDDAAFNMDVCALTSRIMENILDEQTDSGAFSLMAPTPQSNGAESHLPGSAPGWCEAGIILPWTAWQRYGDLDVIERHWTLMNRHVQFILDHNPDHLWRNGRSWDFGDMFSLGMMKLAFKALPATPTDLIATAYWAYSVDLLSQMARAIGRITDAERLRALFDRVCRAFQEAFVHADGTVGSGSQTSHVLALKFNLLSDGVRQRAAERLASDVRHRGVSLTTGMLGARFILEVLTETGFADLAYGLLLRTEFPSWGYMVRQGATTMWENWDGTYESTSDGSVKVLHFEKNHSDFANLSGFFFRSIAGIDAGTPGFETIVIRPVLDPRVKTGGGDYDSIMGRISTDWSQNSDGSFSLDVRIPANTTARIHLPASLKNRIQEGRGKGAGRRDLRPISRTHNEAVFEVGSGSYTFHVER
ncbi:family 78 glycoside hydrolase catalytic domain [Steroidobacter cummioxidans]|uniref:family 78 glycoside hydrolase catalytic domain n=1 Tax=Steroidobacter cummioxidans TaxID=1803913 RepID=UPI000E322B2E|nr:family 78 glycoside hydrolase catalytic domain [Steroidobacter cummioxidans]